MLLLLPCIALAQTVPDEVIHDALMTLAWDDAGGEFWTEGHIVLDEETTTTGVDAHIYAYLSNYGFMDGVFTCSGTNFETLLVELAGGKNIFDDLTERDWVTVSYEEVLAREPDIILIHDYDSPSVEEKIKEITSNPVLSQLDCVKNQRFATIQLESVLPGNRMAYSVERMAADFFPDLFK
jgi:ABC-type Fe3+-hydroxamate transport system substrate-binding protein